MDCEGCEYESIMATSDIILKKFSHIQIEYHSGYKNLKEKLERCGFKVSITGPVATDVLQTYLQSIKQFLSALNFNKKSVSVPYNDANSINYKKNHTIGYVGFIYAIRTI